MNEEVFKFDKDEIKGLTLELTNAKKFVEEGLIDIEKRVDAIKTWWTGPAAVEAFVDTFKKSRKSVSAAINEWIKNEKDCIAEAQQIMDDLDRKLKVTPQAAIDPTAGIVM